MDKKVIRELKECVSQLDKHKGLGVFEITLVRYKLEHLVTTTGKS